MPGIHLVKNNKFNKLYQDISEYINQNFKPEDSNYPHSIGMKKNQDPQLSKLKTNFEYQSILSKPQKFSNIYVVDRENKNSLLHKACEEGNDLLIRFLLNAGLNINQPNTFHESPLYIACLHQREETIDLLLDSGANVNSEFTKKSPLYITLDPENINLTPSEKIIAVNILKKLINKGANINQRLGSHSQFVPIHYAVMDRRELLVRAILESGKADLSLTDVDGKTALHMVADYRNRQEQYEQSEQIREEKRIIELLIPHVISINEKDKWGNTPLHSAVINSNIEVVKAIITKDYLFPQLKILNIKNNKGRTALHEAALEVHRGPEILKLLVQLATQDELAIKSDIIQNGFIFENKGRTALEMVNYLLVEFQNYPEISKELEIIIAALSKLKKIQFSSEFRSIFYNNISEINAKLKRLGDFRFEKINSRLKELSQKAFDLSIDALLPHISFSAIQSQLDILSEKLNFLKKTTDIIINTNYQQALINAKKTLKQFEYFTWKDQQLRLPSSFPELQNDRVDYTLLEKANEKYIHAQTFFENNSLENAKKCFKESIDLYDDVKNYSLMEKAYESLALIYINTGRAKEYEQINQDIFLHSNINDKTKLHAHLALAGFYKALKSHNLSQLFPVSLDVLYAYESYHYSEAYKLAQGSLDNQASIVLQREIGVGNKVKLGTYNIQQCIAVIAHDPHSDKVVLAHFDRFSGPIKFIENILKEFSNTPKINLYLAGARDPHTTVSALSNTKVSDNNINQVLKSIFANRDRFNLLATDVGDKVSPEAIVFNFADKKLEYKMPYRSDSSLNSRAAMMSLQIGQKNGDYLLPLEKIDFNLAEVLRIKTFSQQQQLLIEQRLEGFKILTDVSEAWKHDQLIQPLLAITQLENRSPINYQQALFTHLSINENLFIKQPAFDRTEFLQQQTHQNLDFINFLYTQNLLSPSVVRFNEINTEGIEDDLEEINIQPPMKKICSRRIQKREAELCSIYEDELRKFIVNKQEISDEDLIIDSEAFLKHLATCDSEKQSELLKFAKSSRMTGTKQLIFENIFYNEKLKFHLKKINKISSGLSNGLLYEGALADLFHGDLDSAIQLGGLHIFGHLLNQASNKLNILSQNWITEGKWLRGQFLRASTPYLRRSSSLLSFFNIVRDIKTLKSTTNTDQYTQAMADIISNDIYVSVDLLETGVEIAEVSSEAFAFLGISAVVGPLGEIIGGIVLLGGRIFEAVETVKRENELIKLTVWEKIKEGFRGLLALKPEVYIQNEMDEATEYNTRILPKAWDWLIKHEEFKYIVLPAIRKIGQRSQIVKGKKTCSVGGRLFPRTCTDLATIQVPIFEETEDNKAYFRRKLSGFWKTQESIKAPLASKLLCVPRAIGINGKYVEPNQPDYLCDGVIALENSKINSSGKAFFNLRTGTDYIAGFENVSNVIVVNDGAKDYEGGNQSDIFIFNAKKVISVTLEGKRGGLDGKEGEDILSLQDFRPNADKITVNFSEEKLKYANLTLDIVSIEKVIGGSISLSVIASCDSREIHTQGNFDIIRIPIRYCNYKLKMYLKPNTTVENYAVQGDFTYSIFTKMEGNITININTSDLFDRDGNLLSTHQFLINDSFLNITHISSDFLKLVQFTGKLHKIKFHVLNTQLQSVLEVIQSISIIYTSNAGYINYKFKGETPSPSMFEIINLPKYINKTQIREVFNERDIRLNYQDWTNLNITLTNKHQIQHIILKLQEPTNSSLIKKNYQLEVNTYLSNTLVFHFLDNVSIKIGNKNIFLFHTTSQTVETILSIYKPLARRLNLISTIRTENNESIIIGHKGHEVLNYNPSAFKTHLDGNGGESLFVIDARPVDLRIPNLPSDLRSVSNGRINLADLSNLPLNEVILYHGHDRKINTLDLRPLAIQFQTDIMDRSFNIVFVPPTEENNLNNDLLLLFTVYDQQTQHSIIRIHLKDAVLTDWYLNYLHIIIHVAPQKIIGTLDNLKLQPIPLKFDKKHKTITISVQDVEENTLIYVPTMEETEFFRDGDHLRITNIFNLSKSVSERTILLIHYFNEPKLATLIIKFPHDEIVLSNKSAEIDSAPNFQERKNLWQEAFDTIVYNKTEKILKGVQSLDSAPVDVISSTKSKTGPSVVGGTLLRLKRSYQTIPNLIENLSITEKRKNDNANPPITDSNSLVKNYFTIDSYGSFLLLKWIGYFVNSSCIERMNQMQKSLTQTEELNDSEQSLKDLEKGIAKYGP